MNSLENLNERPSDHEKKPSDRRSRYKHCDHLGIGECPLQWWKENERKFPRISKLARKYLQIPATSASSERSFSTFGNIYCPKRISQKTSTAEAVLFLKTRSFCDLILKIEHLCHNIVFCERSINRLI